MKVNIGGRRIFMAICLHFTSVSGIVLCRTYTDLLFLSTYPKSYLPYFFFGQTVIILMLTFGVAPIISIGSHVISVLILIFLALTIFLSTTLLSPDVYGFPFALSLWLSALSILIGVISWNTVSDAFDIRKFKNHVRWINSAGCIGGLLIGFLIPVIITNFNVEVLLDVLVLLIVFSALAVLNLKPVPTPYKKSRKRTSHLDYQLFKVIFLGVFILMVVDTCADYALKAEMGSTFSKEEIGKYMGPFYGIVSLLSLVVQFGGTNVLLRNFGVTLLLSVLPAFSILCSFGIFFFPGLWLVVLFRMGEMVFRYSLDNIGIQIAMNPLPGQIRRAGKLFLKGFATPLGTGVGALFLWLVVGEFGLFSMAIVTASASFLWFFVIRKIGTEYQIALKDSIRIGRFSVERDLTAESTLHALRNLALHALQEKDPKSVRFGLKVLEEFSYGKLPKEALIHINSEFADIRAAVAKAASCLNDKTTIGLLSQRLEKENDSEVIWQLLETLSVIEPEIVVPKASEFLESDIPPIKAGAILVLLAAGDLDALIEASIALREMIYSTDNKMRNGAARAISAIKAGKLEKELRLLLQDTDEDVCITAIRAAGSRKTLELAGELASKLGNGRVSHYASKTLVEFGLPVTEKILYIILHEEYKKSCAAIRVLNLIADTEVEDAIIEVAKSGQVIIRTILARETAMRARRQPVSNSFREKARQFVIDEYGNIKILRSAENNQSLSDYAKAEIHARQRLAKERFLYWFAVCTKPSEVLDIVSVLLLDSKSHAFSQRRAVAIELLDTIATDRRLKAAITLFEEKEVISQHNVLESLREINDSWLERVLNTDYIDFNGGKMDISQKVMLLRKTNLFGNLPGEILLTIAEESESQEMVKDEIIFSQGDSPDGLYIIASGTVKVKRGDQAVSELKEDSFFGEIGLLDDSPRMADVVAETDGTLLFIEKENFDSIAADLPDVQRALTKTVIGYLKKQRHFQ